MGHEADVVGGAADFDVAVVRLAIERSSGVEHSDVAVVRHELVGEVRRGLELELEARRHAAQRGVGPADDVQHIAVGFALDLEQVEVCLGLFLGMAAHRHLDAHPEH